jgi:hypothetical protein
MIEDGGGAGKGSSADSDLARKSEEFSWILFIRRPLCSGTNKDQPLWVAPTIHLG